MSTKKYAVADLRPCDNCGGVIVPHFYVLRFSLAFVTPRAVNEFFGMHQFFGGNAPRSLVENFAPSSTDAVTVAGDKEPDLMNEAFICATCYIGQTIDLAMLTEKINHRKRMKETNE